MIIFTFPVIIIIHHNHHTVIIIPILHSFDLFVLIILISLSTLTSQVVVKTVSGSVASWPATGNVTTKPLPVTIIIMIVTLIYHYI